MPRYDPLLMDGSPRFGPFKTLKKAAANVQTKRKADFDEP